MKKLLRWSASAGEKAEGAGLKIMVFAALFREHGLGSRLLGGVIVVALAVPLVLAGRPQGGLLVLHDHHSESPHLHHFGFPDVDVWPARHQDHHPGLDADHARLGPGVCDPEHGLLVVLTNVDWSVLRRGRAGEAIRSVLLPVWANIPLLKPVAPTALGHGVPPVCAFAFSVPGDKTAGLLLRGHALLI